MIRQRGQVFPLGLALLLFGVLGVFVLFNTGQVATDKMKLANTADAAAYSGVLWQARALNYQAYSNRAMIANQVSIAQAVTLQSWAAYGAVASENIATVVKPVPVLNVIASGLETGLSVVEKVLTPVTKAIVSVVDVVNRGLSVAQEAMFVSTFVATPDVIEAVVRKTDERFDFNTGFSGLGITSNLNQWNGFTKRYGSDDEAAMDQRASLVNQSRDEFTRERNWQFFNFWFYSTPLTRHKMFREGDTRLIKTESADGVEWEWKAKDTLSLHNRLWHWKGTKRWEVPVGWAEAFANTANSDRTIESGACSTPTQMKYGRCARFLGMNRHAEYLADIGTPSPIRQTQTRTAIKGFSGLQAFRALSTASIEEGHPHLQLKVEVSLPVTQVNDTESLGLNGRINSPVDAPGEHLSSISVAEVFYKRPDADSRSDSALEEANVYNPYWDIRLSSISAEDRLLAFAPRASSAGSTVPDALPKKSVALAEYQASDDSTPEEVLRPSFADSLQSNSSRLLELSPRTEFETVVAAIDQSDLNRFKESIEEELNDALTSAVTNMLKGTLPRHSTEIDRLGSVESLSQELKEQSAEKLGELASPEAAKPYLDAIADAERVAKELEEEFARIRGEIVDGFSVVRSEIEADIDARRMELQSAIAALVEKSRSPALNEKVLEAIQKQISKRRSEMVELHSELKDRLAYALIVVVADTTDLYVMRLAEARFLVDQLLRDESDTVSLPWLEALDDE